ncbi:catechol 2,3-dioxygenase-like lactoylglutathione lyase family enzyme [Actinoplanes lutulentus]|uniref:Catechol 2,3-dioxygenase-like lactoylglutathione lyase family enzyme n=1 Tax=Actinoplanes lutulentus TaxID=1287878 RepID=A0A327ZGP6_9ACTN|nr:VOC family protein [Actinoplanes lutulentus]MBB2948147.1 catechol 2,3-dioxygenase-like lactoylglutathione lyase family enzyme [Actinoplanes lutulentus]RAK39974.1 catechol 2,3-dioxygenase-like lactoylglutathione lyase family enzyme [Actinoplanes lutulentus]
MANQTGRPIAPARKLVAAVMGTLAVFVIVYGLGMSSWPVALFGVAVLVLAVILAIVNVPRRGGRATVAGNAEVKAIPPPPLSSAYGRADIDVIVVAPGLGTFDTVLRESRIPVAKWPAVGSTVPITVDVDDTRRVRVSWNDAPLRDEGEDPPPPATQPAYQETDDRDDDLLGDIGPAPWEGRERDWQFEADEPPPPPAPRAAYTAGPTTPVVVRDTPAGTIVEGHVVGGDDDPPPPLPRRAAGAAFTSDPADDPGSRDSFAGSAASAPFTTFGSGSAASSAPGHGPSAGPASGTGPGTGQAAPFSPNASGSRPPGARPSPRPRGGSATATVERETATGMPPAQRTPPESETAPKPVAEQDPLIDLPLEENRHTENTQPEAETRPEAETQPEAEPARPEAETARPEAETRSEERRSGVGAAAVAGFAAAAGAVAGAAASAFRRKHEPDPEPEQTPAPEHVETAEATRIDPVQTGHAETPAPDPTDTSARTSSGRTRFFTQPGEEPGGQHSSAGASDNDQEVETETRSGPTVTGFRAAPEPERVPTSMASAPSPVSPPPVAPIPDRPFPTAPPPETVAGPAAPPPAVDEIDIPLDDNENDSEIPLDDNPEPAPETTPAASQAVATGIVAPPADVVPDDPEPTVAAATPPATNSPATNPWGDLGGRQEPDARAGDVFTAYPSARPGPAGAIHGVGITVLVTDLNQSVVFYRDVLGFYEIDSGDGSAVLASGDTRLVLRTVHSLPSEAGRLIYLNLEVGDVNAVHDELKAKGVKFVHPPRAVNRGDKLELWSATFRDPDNHNIAITQWRAIR